MKTFKEITSEPEYRERVIKYFRLPMRLSVSEEKFNNDLDYIRQTDKDKFEQIVNFVVSDFNTECEAQGTETPDFTMENILDPILKKFNDNKDWQEFMKQDNSDVLADYKGITSVHGFYTKENDGKHFISFDLQAANWQSLQNIMGFTETYEEMIVQYTDNLIPPVSKTFRTKITGVLGQKNIIDNNKKILRDNKEKILNTVFDSTGIDLRGQEAFAFYADEFLIEIDKSTLHKFNTMALPKIEGYIEEDTNVKVHLTPFTLKWLDVNKSCAKIYKDDYEILNISKDILLIFNKIENNIRFKKTDFEKIKLGKDETEVQFIRKIHSALNEIKLELKYKDMSNITLR